MRKRQLTLRRETLLHLDTRAALGGVAVTRYSVDIKCFHTAEATCLGCVTTQDPRTQGGNTCVACITTQETATLGG